MKNKFNEVQPPPNDDPGRCPITSDGRQCRRRKHQVEESCDFINEAARIVPAGGSFFGHKPVYVPSAEEFFKVVQVRIAELEEKLREANEDRARLQGEKDGHGQ